MDDITWAARWESDIDADGHRALTGLLARAFMHRTEPFSGERSWVSQRPELRIVGSVSGRPVAHLALLRRVMAGLDVPFGMLTCGERVAPFYAAGGWERVTGATRTIDKRQQVWSYGGPTMVLAVRAPMSDWPHGQVVDRNGYEV